MRKQLVVTTVFLLSVTFSDAQFYKTLIPSPDFSIALEKVVSDFRYNFKHIISDSLSGLGESETYRSSVKLPGAVDCFIYKFHSAKDTTASFQALMYDGDDYKEAVRIYKNTFRLVSKSKIQLIDKSVISFGGNLEEPTEDVRFTVSTLQLNTPDYRYNKFRGEVELISTFSGWKVHLNLHNVKADESRE
jgi:hypothetical protein